MNFRKIVSLVLVLAIVFSFTAVMMAGETSQNHYRDVGVVAYRHFDCCTYEYNFGLSYPIANNDIEGSYIEIEPHMFCWLVGHDWGPWQESWLSGKRGTGVPGISGYCYWLFREVRACQRASCSALEGFEGRFECSTPRCSR